MTTEKKDNELDRRRFLKEGSVAAMMAMLGGVRLFAQATPGPAQPAPVVNRTRCAVIGLGAWGREMLKTLGRLPQAEIAAICDSYAPAMRRSAADAPGATQTEDYRTILEDRTIPAVIVATATHEHKEIVLAALKAGKHVYCEAPLANTLEAAREIAQAAKAATRQVFQSGLQMRSDPQRHFLLPFIRSGALGRFVMVRAQWHKKQSWRAVSVDPDRERALNWRLRSADSGGLIGEVGVHQVDQAGWFLDSRPVAVSGSGRVAFWQDDREVPDTVQAVFEFASGVRLSYDATLASSFETEYEMYAGSDGTVMIRENKAWLFKELDAPLLGWEVYARKDLFYKETGIALVANASQLSEQGEGAAKEPPSFPPLYHALQAFLRNSQDVTAAAEDFISIYGADDPTALADHLRQVGRLPAAGYIEGFNATVTAIKAAEALATGRRIALEPAWYELT